ncbi:MAG: hypothetical protein KDD82_03870 [Planctomycetes bacterium]|nr:hypothetical protein [Planctomycetota bacterium]
MNRVRPWVGLAVLLSVGCSGGSSSRTPASAVAPATSATPSAPASAAPSNAPRVVLQLDPALAPEVAARLEALIRGSATRPVEVVSAQTLPSVVPGSLVIGIGATAATQALIGTNEVAQLPAEGYLLRSDDRQGSRWIAAVGEAGHPIATLYGAYALLEDLGFGFLHPLQPVTPQGGLRAQAPIDRSEAPHWPTRGWHVHTMHPLELTHVLNGWGPGGTNDDAGWRALLPEWERFCEWAVANGQNEVEWVLLYSQSWAAFAESPERQARLAELVRLGHAYGLKVGVDAPLALRQQHAFTLVRTTGPLPDEVAQIEARLDYLLAAGFDFVATELGFSEFTRPDDRKQLAWLDAFSAHLQSKGKEGLAKIHVSQGQLAPNFPDPATGQPINFNFLPQFADPSLGVMPHTVQHYAMDDPAPTYGNTDFTYMRDFMYAQAGKRKTLWHPETAYWVSFDIDVPLFLPVYAERRLYDLRQIDAAERAGQVGQGAQAGSRIDGQMVFSSGWEWGYWLNDVITARAAWSPEDPQLTLEQAYAAALERALRCFGPAARPLAQALVEVSREQREILIEGKVRGQAPSSVLRRNGQAYVQGWETWDEVMKSASLVPGVNPALTQPDKIGLIDVRRPAFLGGMDYGDFTRDVKPLLHHMAWRFGEHVAQLSAIAPLATPETQGLFAELIDGATMNALRARQVYALYDYATTKFRQPDSWRQARLQIARDALDAAQAVVVRRETHYRVNADRIAGWGDNPTSYEFGYLWTARRLHFWWRDEGKAVRLPLSPAYMNHIDPLDTAFGEGSFTNVGQALRQAAANLGLGAIGNLFDAPPSEPTYPPPGVR